MLLGGVLSVFSVTSVVGATESDRGSAPLSEAASSDTSAVAACSESSVAVAPDACVPAVTPPTADTVPAAVSARNSSSADPGACSSLATTEACAWWLVNVRAGLPDSVVKLVAAFVVELLAAVVLELASTVPDESTSGKRNDCGGRVRAAAVGVLLFGSMDIDPKMASAAAICSALRCTCTREGLNGTGVESARVPRVAGRSVELACCAPDAVGEAGGGV
mmetsp:Transcript_13548/g.40854  ORF Transcript_13548/g.40854 Transcript_13548/m.40854 type:complete len:220 (+) Transcript_13548:1444-2103(+)